MLLLKESLNERLIIFQNYPILRYVPRIRILFSINNQDKGKWQSENAENLIENLIKFLIETKDTNGLYKLDFILKEHVFSDTIHYTKALKDFQPNLTEFMNSPSRVFEMEKSINYVNMLKFTDTLDKKKNTITNSKSLKI